MINKLLSLLISLLFLTTAVITVKTDDLPPLHEDYTELALNPSDSIVDLLVNSTVTISLYVTLQPNVTIDAVGTELIHFTPGILKCRSIEWGNLFEDDIIRLDGVVDNASGTIIHMVWGSMIPTDKSGYYANFTFDVLAKGYASVTIDADPTKTNIAFEMNPVPWQITHNATLSVNPIIISNEYPENQSMNMPHNLLLNIDIVHTLGEHMGINWMSNATGAWKIIGIDNNLPNGTYDMSCYGIVESPYDQKLTYACTDYTSNVFHVNDCPGRKIGYITKVELYAPSYSGQIRPIFDATRAGEIYMVPSGASVDITNDASAPTVWEWSDIVNLDVYKESSSPTYVNITYDLGFGDDVSIYWSVNVTDGEMWRNETYWYFTEMQTPTISNPVPSDAETWLTYYPTLSAEVVDPNGDTMNISFYYQNETEEWEQIGTTQIGENNTYYQSTTFATYSSAIYWRVLVDDGNHTVERQFRFTFRDVQGPPIAFTAKAICDQSINLTWVKPEYADSIRIQRRPDHFPIGIDDGLDIYNGTGEQVYDTAVLPGTIYYYTAWSWNDTDKTWSIENSSAQEVTAPLEPSNLYAETTGYNSTHLTWDIGEGAKSTIIRRATGTYPVDQGDGEAVYEGNSTSYDDTDLGSNITYYYRAWSHYFGAILEPRYINDLPYTGFQSAYINTRTWIYQNIEIPAGESMYLNKLAWHTRGYYIGYFLESGAKYGCVMYIYGEEFGWVLLHNYVFGESLSGWENITVPDVYLQGGHTYTLGLQGYHGCSPHCAYSPAATWDTNANGTLYKMWGYYGYYSCGTSDDYTTTDVGPPQVFTNEPTLVDDYTAQLNAYLFSDGGESTTCGFIWENESGPQNTTIGSYPLMTPYLLNITGLAKGNTYAFRAWSYNAYGYTQGEQISFATRPVEPTNIAVDYFTDETINLTFDKGLGADKTMVRIKTGSYPANVTDGSLVSFDENDYATAFNLSGNIEYFFRIWSYNESNDMFSSGYDEITQITLVGTPNITSQPTTNIEDTAARLNAIVTSDGGGACTVGFRYGTSPGIYTDNVTVPGTYRTSNTAMTNLSSLTIGTRYYFQSWILNIVGFVASSEENFSTKPVAPSSLTAQNYGAQQINLTWAKGTGADKTWIQQKTGSYPISTTDGTNIYAGNASSYNNIGLTENTTYYYRAWSYNDSNGLYSVLNDSAYDTTDWLPNVTYMSPCGEENINRPVLFSGIGEDDNPLVYRFNSLIGDNNRRLGDYATGDWGTDPWANYVGWDPATISNVLEYGNNAYCKALGYWSEDVVSAFLYVHYDEPVLATGIQMSYTSTFPDSNTRTRIRYHDFYNDIWYDEQVDGLQTEMAFGNGATIVDEVAFSLVSYGHYGHSRYYYNIYCDYLTATRLPVEIYNTTATSGEQKQYTWISDAQGLAAYSENYTSWWQLEVFNGIDSGYSNCSFTTEKIDVTSVSPYDGETLESTLDHVCSVQVNHSGGDIMTVYFQYYNDSNWIAGGSNSSVGNGTYRWTYLNSDELSVTYLWRVCIWDGLDWHNETFDFNIRAAYTPAAPTFSISNNGTRGINLTDITGDPYTNSIMMRFKLGAYPTDRNDGTLLFNGTDIQYQHTGLDPNTNYCYRAWGYNITDNLWGAPGDHSLVTLGPGLPAFTLAKFNSTVINITGIIKNEYADTVLIRAKIGSYPTSRTDGDFVCDTAEMAFDHIGLTPASDYYYSAWAYDAPDNWWSDVTQHHQKTNGPATVNSPYPNNIKISGVNPTLQINVDEYNDEDDINVYFRSNCSGTWATINAKIGVYEGTKSYPTTEFYQQDVRYWWSINVTDGEFWINSTYTFETGSMEIPTITATTFNTSVINLVWTNALGTTHTYITRKIDSYPLNRTDGTNIYFGTGNHTDDVGISPGELCRYTVWSYNATLDVYSSQNTTAQALTKPRSPVNFTATKVDYQTINLTWINGEGSQRTRIIYKPDEYPTNYNDGILIYDSTGTSCNATGLMPDDFLNFFTPIPGTDNFGVYAGGGDPFNNSCDGNDTTKWDLNRTKTGNFSYLLGIEPQRVKGFSILFKDFYNETGADWNAAITKFEVYNGTWQTVWSGEKYNTGIEKEWWVYQSENVYRNISEIRFSAWTQFITPDLYEVQVGKLGYVHCFKAWGYVEKGGLYQYSDDYNEAENKTEDTPPNVVPYITLNSPENGSTSWERNPLFNITIADYEGQLMNISWQYLNDGNWTELSQTTLVGNGTYTYSPSVFNNLSTWYYWRVNVSDTADIGYSAIYKNNNMSPTWSFKTRDAYAPNPPTTFTATEYGAHAINMTWSMGTYADRTYIERNTTATWTRGQGVFRFNDTGVFYQDTGLLDDTTYYYQAWGYNSTDGTYSLSYSSDDAKTEYSPNDPPDQPFNPAPANNTDYMNVYDIWLNCTVTDPDADIMTVLFYWGNGTLIDTISGVSSGSTASLYLPDYWSRDILGYACYWVTHDTTHTWYAVADDTEYQTQGPTWNFHTNKAWDLNADRRVNVLDLSSLVSHYGLRVTPPGGSSWDINEDSYTNVLDLSSLVSHYGQLY